MRVSFLFFVLFSLHNYGSSPSYHDASSPSDERGGGVDVDVDVDVESLGEQAHEQGFILMDNNYYLY